MDSRRGQWPSPAFDMRAPAALGAPESFAPEFDVHSTSYVAHENFGHEELAQQHLDYDELGDDNIGACMRILWHVSLG
jgi:hypothetical protein